MPLTDPELLRRFAESQDDSAFAELVGRHIDFVYASALRQLHGDTHRAEDVVQDVFTKLARRAAEASQHPALLGWLCTTTRFAAIDAIRREARRRAREEAAHAMNSTSDSVDWDRLQPVIDSALADLPSLDRELVLARYFGKQSFADIGAQFQLSENAAQKRVERALDKLRLGLARRRVTSTSAALGVALGSLPAMAAPCGMAAVVTHTAIGSLAAAGASSTILFMSAQKFITPLIAVALVTGVGTAIVGARASREAEAALASASRDTALLTSQLRKLEARAVVEDQRAQKADQENARLLAAAQAPGTTAVAGEGPITSEVVTRRFRRAQQLVDSGEPAEALRELIWCYDIGFPRTSDGNSPVRSSSILLFARLAERYPPALAFLRDRQAQARDRYQSDPEHYDYINEYAALNHALKDDAVNVALADQLPPDDRRRSRLLTSSRDYLVQAQRYADAAGTWSYDIMTAMVERHADRTRNGANAYDTEEARATALKVLVSETAQNIEILAGAGQTANARDLASRLLRQENSEATRRLLQQHLTRAGQPDLLKDLPTP